MEEIKVIKVNPLELPSDVVWSISGKYHISLKEFVVYEDKKENILYINENVPEEDITRFIEVVKFPHYWVDDYDGGFGEYFDQVYDKYGYASYTALKDAHKWRMEQKAEEEAKEKAQRAFPAIEKMINAGMYDEYIMREVYGMGKKIRGETRKNIYGYGDVSIHCLGYLTGKGETKEEYTPREIENEIDCLNALEEMIWDIPIHEIPGIYKNLKERYFAEESEV